MAAQIALLSGAAARNLHPLHTLLTRRVDLPTRKRIQKHGLRGAWVGARLGCGRELSTTSTRRVGFLGSQNIGAARGQQRQIKPCADAGAAGMSEENYASLQQKTQAMVETAMLAAFAGLAYYLGTALRLEAHLGSFLPLPIVIGAARWNPRVAAKVLAVTALLLAILAGLQRAISYVLIHGLMALSLSVLWSMRLPWSVTIPIASVVRSGGMLVSLAISSYLLRENLLAMVAAQMSTLAEQMGALMGISGTPALHWIYILIFVVVIVNSLTYLLLLHVLYTILLSKIAPPGFCRAPKVIQRMLFGPTAETT
eukprot:CAMPEP_0118925312 /NCGR_PEP_ID=MMETSP1169-20130426/3213_1 /TAXON_ID=36882 /ORGANISM="Pyramimonas obovata, Strain CCMP722" /LENGTH=311 /DNA_ID=CAMNT_0006866565 /DNA_START=78 /DNA_END=1013 /DNA_ORIENTATION=-